MLEIVKMTAQHVDDVHVLEQISFPQDTWPKTAFMLELSKSVAFYIVALADGKVVGYAGMHHVEDAADIVNIAVHPYFRRMGIASAMLNTLEAQVLELGVTTITLEVRLSNAPAQKLYQSHGFAAIAVREGYYRTPKEDAVIMQKSNLGGNP
ncbi:MAG: ribosomal protein S18-alanine N-acetyltransferase [Defluviitaleaceae bacterium]|nr:ribosomal protein S18-alanine N-acetyltransferase [Defluviitaleaceae bacterium]